MPIQYEHLLFLVDRIPLWLEKLSAIKSDCISSSQPKTVVSKSSSPDPDAPLQAISFATTGTAATGGTTTTTDTGILDNSGALSTSYRLRHLRSRRRSASIRSIDDTVQLKYRLPDDIVVEYDADAQNVLREIVEEIGRGRDLIRRARAQARQHSFCRRGSQQAREADLEEDDDLDDDTVMTQVRLRRKRTNEASMCGDDALDNMQTCDESGRHLLKAQNLCAQAAYQLLRDGECKEEVKKASEELEDAFAKVQQALIVLEGKGSASPLAYSNFDRHMRLAAASKVSSNRPFGADGP